MNDVARLLEMRFGADPEQLKTVRAEVRTVAERAGFGVGVANEVVIAVNEACMNIIQHAYKGDKSGEILLEIHNNGAELEVVLKDFAAPVDCGAIRPRELADLRPGGLGTHFIREIMDECVYGHLDGVAGNFVRMKKKLARDG